ncbi:MULTISPECIES: hypothetical protein [Streptomyces]|uniref:hypothetical protein n=1 Tax=Streptomyces TaxID=1883 RepID=UPI001F41B8E8|nr:hypothetical protein [Streptomyces sp. CBMAI 2042]
MSRSERTVIDGDGKPPAPEPQPWIIRWKSRARRIRNEAGIYLVRGAATAIGGSIVIYTSTWLSLR